jgi:hypothetical protein
MTRPSAEGLRRPVAPEIVIADASFVMLDRHCSHAARSLR